ncbi:UMP-CMP kinase 2, mitochondrial isoform X2 [Patella vulgata]|nr:UMP-CMP kinase 2, mitochondrial isoform X2 [Patella vulgata]
MEAVQELLKIYNNFECARETTADLELKFPFVVVEGLDGAGKTTLTGILQKKLGAVLYCTPPPIIGHLRKHFTSLPEIIARAYYQVGNCIVARQILEECQSKAVIMDRYWHSTAAYGIANETSLTDMPPAGHCTYNWPPSLLKPNIVLFLSVTEETRQKRMTNRHGEMTFEEKVLDSDIVFRKRLYEAYKRFVDPACLEIDANGSVDSVVEKTLIALKEHGI